MPLMPFIIKVVRSLCSSLVDQVEEMVLDYLAWTSESPLYDAIDAAGSVPNYEDVALPAPTAGGVATPLIHPAHSRVVSSLGALRGNERTFSVPLSLLKSVHVNFDENRNYFR